MRRLTAAMMVGAVAVLVTASVSQAQYVFLGGGASFPSGPYKDEHKTGWLATAGLGFDIGDKGLWVEAQGYFGSNKFKDTSGDKTNIIQGMGALGYTFMPEKSVTPWVMAGIGFLQHKYVPATGTGDASTSFAWEGGAGLSFKASSKANVWVGGQYTSGTGDNSGTKFLAALAGVTLNFGGN